MNVADSHGRRTVGWIAGQVVQGTVLGLLSIWALIELVSAIGGVQAFRYEGF